MNEDVRHWIDWAKTAEATIERVRKLHRPKIIHGWGSALNACSNCQRSDGWPEMWPCQTIEALGLSDA